MQSGYQQRFLAIRQAVFPAQAGIQCGSLNAEIAEERKCR
jgi:hypothetical protein